MRYSEGALAAEGCFRVSSPTQSLVDSLYRFGYIMVHEVVYPWVRSLAARPPPPPSIPSVVHNPPFPDDDILCQYHLSLAQKLRPSSSSVPHLWAEDDVQIVGERPVSAGGFADIWKGYLDTRQVAVKSYRRYLSVDLSQVYLVGLVSSHEAPAAETSSAESFSGSHCMRPPFTPTHRVIHRDL